MGPIDHETIVHRTEAEPAPAPALTDGIGIGSGLGGWLYFFPPKIIRCRPSRIMAPRMDISQPDA